ncbi:ELKS/Rab6-interacting/CAST family protein [Jiella sp. MQZ9-1]|uniref:Uncharacterized protein n=1 Tax=Jiella flava TaxID=2816857 RepID=A0A939JVR4_9HYPH|nr:hypothetical protein [Jiella flava]MBO0664490.1 hypothetical protein [Jiella flava]MCD2473126.1 ELKS/Rab6-interacting/CAST family protein [Jiella flava]
MGGSTFIPIVVAALVGLFFGWLLGPNVSDVKKDVDKQIASLKQPVDSLKTDVQSVSDSVKTTLDASNKSVTDALNGLKSDIDNLGKTVETKTDAIAKAAQPKADQGLADLKSEIAKLQDSVAALGSNGGAAASSSGGGDVAALVKSVGATGAILVPGQSAIFGSSTVSVSGVAEGSAKIAAGNGEAKDVKAGESVDVGEGCQVTLAGVASGAVFLSSKDCEGEAAKDASAKGAATSEGGQEPAAESGSAKAAEPASEQASSTSSGTATSGGKNGPVSVGGVATFGKTRVFVSGIDESGAMLMIVGGKREQVATGSSIDAGNGCSITLDSTENNTATLSAKGCEGAGEAAKSGEASKAKASGGAATAAKPEQSATTSAAKGASESQAASASSGEGAPGSIPTGNGSYAPGQTAIFGKHRVFVSSIDEGGATLFPVGGNARQDIKSGSSLDLGDGCSVSVGAIKNDKVALTAKGCDGGNDQAATPNDTAKAAAASAAESSASSASSASSSKAMEKPAADDSSAKTSDDATAAKASDTASSSDSSGSGSGLTAGQTKSFGKHKVFVSAVTDQGATLYVVGSGRKEVKSGESIDAGDGCSVKLDKIDGNSAMLSASGC